VKKLAFLLFLSLAAWANPAAEAGGHGGAHGGGDPLLTAKWVNFAILACALGFVAVKFGGPALRGQQQAIVDGMNSAAKRAEAAAAEAKVIEQKISGLGAEVAILKEKAQTELAAEAVRLEQETAQSIQKLAQMAEQDVASAAKFARAELKAEAARLALELAKQKVQARMTGEVQGALVDRFVANLNTQPEARG
jgi:F-type H+-transporting ATPase subunit b